MSITVCSMQVCVHVCVHERMLNNGGSGFVEDTVTRHRLIHLAPAN